VWCVGPSKSGIGFLSQSSFSVFVVSTLGRKKEPCTYYCTSDPSSPQNNSTPSLLSSTTMFSFFSKTLARCDEPPPPPPLPSTDMPPPPPTSTDVADQAPDFDKTSSCTNPGTFETLSSSLRGTTSLDVFDGTRVLIQKQLSPQMVVGHNFFLGSSQFGPEKNKHFQLSCQVNKGKR